MSDYPAREAAAREALSRYGLTLTVCYSQRRHGEYFAITANPDPNTETTTNLPTMELVEDYIFELTHREQSEADPADVAAPLKPIESQPYIGAPVHYVSYGTPGGEYPSVCRAAIVTEVNDQDPVPEHGVPYVGLCVLNPTGQFFKENMPYDDGDTLAAGPTNLCDRLYHPGGTWHWPAHG